MGLGWKRKPAETGFPVLTSLEPNGLVSPKGGSMTRTLYALVLFSASTLNAQGPSDLEKLPVKRVVLYKNGVGYFEHLGSIRNSQDVAIAFTSNQLNDVLKSLTVLDLDGGSIGGVAYGSAAPVERQLGDLRLPLGEKSSLTEFLGALRGARLEVRTATGVITGRLLSVERKTRMGGGATLEVDYLSLITESGEVKTTEVSPSFSVRLLERGLAGKVDRYLDVVGANREADVRRMVISTVGSGERSLFVSYISEVPVWKATYRIVLNAKRAPLLQGWAIVDNTVGQDWEKVQLSLVAGAPQSFVQNLSQPYYSRRPVVPLPGALSAAPQTYEATLVPGSGRITGVVADATDAAISGARLRAYDAGGVLAGETTADAAGRYELQGMPEGPIRLDVEAPGFRRVFVEGVMPSAGTTAQQNVHLPAGATVETVTVRAAAGSLNSSASTQYPLNTNINAITERSGSTGSGRGLGSGAGLGGGTANKASLPGSPVSARPASTVPSEVDDARSRMEPAARAQELGDLFEYKLKEPITIPKNRSALVPIVQTSIAAEKVSVWNERAGLPRPQRALWLNNSSGLTLDGGSFSVLEDETFAGEGLFEPIRPGEKRLVSYATDLALNVNAHSESERERVSRVRVLRGVLTLHNEVRESKTYTFRNEDSSPRTVIIEHPVRAGYELRGDVQPVEVTPGWMRFRLHVDAKQTASLVVNEARTIESAHKLTNITNDQVALFVRQKSIDKTIEDALRKILEQRSRIQDLEGQKSDRDDETEKIFDDQQRLRENIKVLKGSPEEKTLLQRYTRQLNDQEDRLEKLRKEIEDLAARQEKAQAALDQMIEELSFDIKL